MITIVLILLILLIFVHYSKPSCSKKHSLKNMTNERPSAKATVYSCAAVPGKSTVYTCAAVPGKAAESIDNTDTVLRSIGERSDDDVGDDPLFIKMKELSDKNLESINNRVRLNSENLRRFFDEELDQQENRHWWEQTHFDE